MLLGEALQCLGEPGQRGLWPLRRRERHRRHVREPAARQHDTDVRVSAPELGRDREPVAAAEPQDLARAPSLEERVPCSATSPWATS